MRSFFCRKATLIVLIPALLLGIFMKTAQAKDDLPTFQLEMNDGRLSPARLVVPAGRKIMIELHNKGKTPAEFESIPLRKEKVLAPGAKSFIVIAPLSAGEYPFFDDFRATTAKGVLVAQ